MFFIKQDLHFSEEYKIFWTLIQSHVNKMYCNIKFSEVSLLSEILKKRLNTYLKQ